MAVILLSYCGRGKREIPTLEQERVAEVEGGRGRRQRQGQRRMIKEEECNDGDVNRMAGGGKL